MYIYIYTYYISGYIPYLTLQRFNTFPATINGGEKTNLELARDVGASEAGHLKREMAWQWI